MDVTARRTRAERMLEEVRAMMRFEDRGDAGRRLAALLGDFRHKDAVVLALPRGGVPVGFEVAKALKAPLDIFVVRKLGLPTHEETAMGAIAAGGVTVLDRDLIRSLGISDPVVQEVIARESEELARRERAFRAGRTPVSVEGRTALLVDDGLATGATMLAAVAALRASHPSQIVVAVPVGSPSACRALAHAADHVVCMHRPERFDAVGSWYDDFSQTTDADVLELLVRSGDDARAWPVESA